MRKYESEHLLFDSHWDFELVKSNNSWYRNKQYSIVIVNYQFYLKSEAGVKFTKLLTQIPNIFLNFGP